MSRKLATNAELKTMINERFREGNELDGDCRDVKISGVQLYPEPDETGCNWNVWTYNGSDVCKDVFRTVIEEFRREYSLADN